MSGPPYFGVDHELIVNWINALPEPFRGFVCALETNADPSGNIRDAVCQRENAEALAVRLRQSEAELVSSHERILELVAIERSMRESNSALRERLAGAIDAITSARLVSGSAECAWSKQALEALRG